MRHPHLISMLVIGGIVALGAYQHAEAAQKYTFVADRDTTVYARYPQKNFGLEPYLVLTGDEPPSSSIPSQILLHFDLSSLQFNPGDRVSSANLKLTQVRQRGWGATPIRAHRLADMFNGEAQVVWEHPTAPFFTARLYNIHTEQSPLVTMEGLRFFGNTVTLDIKDIVQRWLVDGAPNNGILITAEHPNPCYCAYGIAFFSRESRSNGSADLQDLTPRALGQPPTLTIGITRSTKQ